VNVATSRRTPASGAAITCRVALLRQDKARTVLHQRGEARADGCRRSKRQAPLHRSIPLRCRGGSAHYPSACYLVAFAQLSRDNNVEADEVRLILEVQDLEPGLTRSYAVASYVRAMLKLNALRRELGDTLLVVEGRKKALRGLQLAEAQRLLDRYGVDAR
jgi:hypothetical protein